MALKKVKQKKMFPYITTTKIPAPIMSVFVFRRIDRKERIAYISLNIQTRKMKYWAFWIPWRNKTLKAKPNKSYLQNW